MSDTQSSAAQAKLVEQVLELTLAMEHATHMQDWRGAARLARKRSPLLMSLSRNQTPASLEHIERIRTVTGTIAKEAEVAMAGLSAEFQAAKARSSAALKYLRGATGRF
ncbi:flagellar protein FliT [Burkholderia sp. WAC0059]|uniref:flagellar protein FliT n=1 Tax=Burkholderia sp. WAC0059 TaxID=2066022 RepID=UPI000C7F292A|nr:flagellar protein FliT [Burkholderia sp. WAC0059]PLZ01905.1 flagellar protein FliT [Burkholderia sp. WAC0059]